MHLSVVIPVRNEEACLAASIAALRAGLHPDDEVLVVDGGSSDRSAQIAADSGARVLRSPAGRGTQMNVGARAAQGDVLLFLHADTSLPNEFRAELDALMGERTCCWGRFDLEFDEGGPLLRLIAWLISRRSRTFRSATGDQAIFVRRADFEAVGGYREPVLFEDVDLVRRLRARGGMAVPGGRVVTSARRWRNRGVLSTTLKMWTLKSLYLLGIPSAKLVGFYRDER